MRTLIFALYIGLFLFSSCQNTTPKKYEEVIVDCYKPNSIIHQTSCVIGAQIPEFSATDLEGNLLTRERLQSKYTLINFWYIECPPCLKELPHLNTYHETYDQLEVLSFCLNTKEELLTFMEEQPISFSTVPSSEKIIKEVFLSKWGYPTSFLVNRKGVIEAVYRQFVEGSPKEADLLSRIRS